MPAYRYEGFKAGATTAQQAAFAGFALVCAMPYQQAHDLRDDKGNKLIQHPVSCVDCHDPRNMELRVTRPAFINGIKALKAKEGNNDYDPNRDATRQEMRSFVCGQCHVEYYFKGEGKLLTYPWADGLKVEQIEGYYDRIRFSDWKHGESAAPMLKAQHPEFETWNQGVHARSGVACADCHMPYMREGALKVSDHHVRSPVLNVSRACQICHRFPEEDLKARVDEIQSRTHELVERAAACLTDMLDAIKQARAKGVTDEQLKVVFALHRKAQWRLDFVVAENSMGFHAPQETARILGEAIDYFRQGQLQAMSLGVVSASPPRSEPATQAVEGVAPR
jgi:nitrite reductase (cytochrome c-552)